MLPTKTNKTRLLLAVLVLILTGLACGALTNGGEPQRTTEQLFPGVTYIKEVRTEPRRMVVHIVKMNLAKGGIKPLVTPADRPPPNLPNSSAFSWRSTAAGSARGTTTSCSTIPIPATRSRRSAQ